jgi:type VI protein secretion system component Hcp
MLTAAPAGAQPSPPTNKFEMTLEGLPAHGAVGADAATPSDQGAATTASTAGGAASEPKPTRTVVQDFHFTLVQSPMSTMLLEAMAEDTTLRRVTVRFGHAGSGRKLELAMSKVRVSSYQTGGYSGDWPTDQISLTFASATMTVEGAGGKHSARVGSAGK